MASETSFIKFIYKKECCMLIKGLSKVWTKIYVSVSVILNEFHNNPYTFSLAPYWYCTKGTGMSGLSDIFFSTAWWTRAGTGHGRVLGNMFLSRTGSAQHRSTQDIKEGATPGDKDGGAKLKPATDKLV